MFTSQDIFLFKAFVIISAIILLLAFRRRLWHWFKGSLNYHLNRKGMLDRIAELESDLQISRDDERRWLSALDAIRQDINLERQRFRSEPAQEIRENIEMVMIFEDGTSPLPSDSAVNSWLRIFKSRREQREMAKKKAVLSSRN